MAGAINIVARGYRTGDITQTSSPVQSRTAGDAVRSIGQGLAALGLANSRYGKDGKINIPPVYSSAATRIRTPPPNRVKPFSIIVLQKVVAVALATNDEETQCVCNMIIVAYFSLLRPGEYTGAKSDSTPFRMCDITFSCGRAVFDHRSDKQDLHAATMVMLLFTTHKNGLKGEVLGQGPSGYPLLCPRDTLARRIIHLRKHNADKTRPIASFMTPKGSWKHVTPTK